MSHADPSARFGPRWLPVPVALLVLVAAVYFWYTLRWREQSRFRDATAAAAERVENRLVSYLDAESFALVRMAKQWEYWAHGYPEVWSADTANFIAHHPGYQAIAWVDPGLTAQWVAPQKDNAWLRNRNLAGDEALARALTAASHRLEVTVADADFLPGERRALVACVPISKDNQFAGYIVGVYDAERLLGALLDQRLKYAYRITVTAAGRPVYRKSTAPGRPLGPSWQHTSALEVHGIRWQLRLTPTDETRRAAMTALPAAILVAGSLVAVLLALSVHLVQKTTMRARQLKRFNLNLEQRVAERTSELARAKDEADAANRAKCVFLANMSHEIRTPLNAVIGLTDLVLDSPLNTQQQEYLKMVHNSGESLLTVINDILDFSKIEAGRLELDEAPFETAEAFGDMVKSLAIRAHAKGLELLYHVDQQVPAWLYGDAGRLRQILLNLVGNAIKFTRQGEVALHVSAVRHGPQDVELRCAVRDTGIGIPADKLARIFEPFEQAETGTTRRFGGTGLGLAISARLVELMHGRIWAESKPGQGTTIRFTARMAAAEAPRAQAPRSQAALAGLPVLVVDDHATNRKIVSEMLSQWGLAPRTAASGSAALEVMHDARRLGRPVRLVVADADMPGMDGFALVRQLRRDHLLENDAIMMVTSGRLPDAAPHERPDGVFACLIKPLKPSELFNALVATLGLAAVQREDPPARRAVPEHPPLKILLAEDSMVNRQLAIGLLEKHGHQVAIAHNGAEALEACQQNAFDVVLMDVEMPEMDGLEATRALRAREQTTGRRTPVIAMTAHAMKGDRERCLEAGMDDYVSKPVRPDDLFDSIQRVRNGRADRTHRAEPAAAPRDAEWDPDAALAAAHGDPQLLRQVAHAFLQECPRWLAEIETGRDAGDTETVMRAAHTLKSSLRTFAAPKAQRLAEEIEQQARAGNLTIQQPLDALGDALDRLQPALADHFAFPQPADPSPHGTSTTTD